VGRSGRWERGGWISMVVRMEKEGRRRRRGRRMKAGRKGRRSRI